jgi:hypothetical protein
MIKQHDTHTLQPSCATKIIEVDGNNEPKQRGQFVHVVLLLWAVGQRMKRTSPPDTQASLLQEHRSWHQTQSISIKRRRKERDCQPPLRTREVLVDLSHSSPRVVGDVERPRHEGCIHNTKLCAICSNVVLAPEGMPLLEGGTNDMPIWRRHSHTRHPEIERSLDGQHVVAMNVENSSTEWSTRAKELSSVQMEQKKQPT